MRNNVTDQSESLAMFRCTLFTAVRNEAPFLVEWIAYHKSIGIDNIVVVSNDCSDGTLELLDALQSAGEITHFSHTVLPNQRAQEKAANIANELGVLNNSEWAIWLDADEFLNIHVGAGRIDDLISELGDHHGILLHWRLFGDGGNKRFGGRFISQDFTQASEDESYFHYNLKTFFRVTPDQTWLDMSIHRPRLKQNAYSLSDFVTGDGIRLSKIAETEDEETDPMEFWFINGNWINGVNKHKVRGVKKFGTFGHSLAQINHYAVRTPELYALKVRRGNGFTEGGHIVVNERHNLEYYRKYNGHEINDDTILRYEQAVTREMGRMRQHTVVAEAERAANAIVTEQISRVSPEEIALYESINNQNLDTKVGEESGSSPSDTSGNQDLDAEKPDISQQLTEKTTNKLPFKIVSKTLKDFVRAEGLAANLKAAWVYRNTCFVLNFDFRGVVFGFNFTPNDQGTLEIDVLNRRSHSSEALAYSVTRTGERKEQLASHASLDEAKAIIRQIFYRTVAEVTALIDTSGSPAVPIPASTQKQVQVEGQIWGDSSTTPSNSKKIGVLTLPLIGNVGGNLQAYAMMEALKELGHRPVFLNRRKPTKHFNPDYDRFKDAQIPLLSKSIGLGRNHPTRQFIERHITPLSRTFHSSSQLAENIARYDLDAVIVGSDQVWRPQYAGDTTLDMFLKFLHSDDKTTKRIAYSASFGVENLAFRKPTLEAASSLLQRFDAVSVREDSAVDLCQEHFGVAAEHTLDPTLLLSTSNYRALFSERPSPASKGQLSAYVLDQGPEKTQLIRDISNRLSIDAYTAYGQLIGENDNAETPKETPDQSVENWLSSLFHASFVVTDSFHGVAFSILFNRPFVAYGNSRRGMARFKSILRMFDLEDRLVTDVDQFSPERHLKEINWESVNAKRDQLRKHSLDYIGNALTDKKKVEQSYTEVSVPFILPIRVNLGDSADIENPKGNSHPLNVFCTGCGACVSEAKGSLKMAWNTAGFLAPVQTSETLPPEAVKVCPFNPAPDKEVEDEDALARMFLPNTRYFDPRAGRFNECYIGYSKAHRENASSGGITTYVFEELLDRGIVDHIFVVKLDSEKQYTYDLISKAEDVVKTSKTRYFPVSLDKLFEMIDEVEGQIAVSGVSCFIKALRLKQHYNPELKKKIPFLSGIICGGLKSRHYTDFLAKSAGAGEHYTRPDYRVKNPEKPASDYSFSAIDENLQKHQIRMKTLGDMWGSGLFKAKACDFCTDVLGELSDISLGDAWIPKYSKDGKGNSVVVIRSDLAAEIIRDGIKAGELHLDKVSIDMIARSQTGAFNHKHKGIKFRIEMAKNSFDRQVPFVRPRIMSDVSAEEMAVQLLRERTRSKSLKYWLETKNPAAFMKRMKPSRQLLRKVTEVRKQKSKEIQEEVTSVVKGQSDFQFRNKGIVEISSLFRWLRSKLKT